MSVGSFNKNIKNDSVFLASFQKKRQKMKDSQLSRFIQDFNEYYGTDFENVDRPYDMELGRLF